MTYENFDIYVSEKYKAIDGDNYMENPKYIAAINAVEEGNSYKVNEDCKEFAAYYEKRGFTINYLPAVKSNRGVVVSKAYYYATKDINVVKRLFKYFGNMFKFETIHDVEDPHTYNFSFLEDDHMFQK